MHFFPHGPPSSGKWVLRHLACHDPVCFGAPTLADGAPPGETSPAFKSAFTANQVARLVVSSTLADANMNMAAVRGTSSGCFLRSPSSRFYVNVKRAALLAMATDRHVDMAALPFYAEALRELGHEVPPPSSWPLPLLRARPRAYLLLIFVGHLETDPPPPPPLPLPPSGEQLCP